MIRKEVVLEDQELWSLLHGYGPNPYSRPRRTMDEFQRWCYIRDRLLKATEGLRTIDQVTLVLEIDE